MDWGNRGQSTVVGVTLVFGLIIIALGTTQAFVVPQQNAAVAQQHWENARNDMTQLRSVMDRVANRRSTASVAVKLGQRLPDRPFLVEGTPPSGTLETQPVKITIRGTNYSAPVERDSDGNDIIEPVELNGSSATKELRYRQSGGDWQTLTSFIGPISTFVKQDGQVSQAVVESGDRIDVLILKGNVSAGGISTENVQLEGAARSCAAVEGEPSTEIEVSRRGSPDRQIDWADGKIRTVCLLVIGINGANVSSPPLISPNPGSTGGNNNTLFNPTRPLRFECADQRSSSNKTVTDITFTNTDTNSIDINTTRIPAYQDGESSGKTSIPNSSDVIDPTGSVAGTVEVAGPLSDITNIGFSGGESRTISLDFSGSNATQLDVIVLRFTLVDNRVVRYYIQVQRPGECNHAGAGGGGSPSINSVSVTDNSNPNKAKFDVSVDVSNPPSSGEIDVTFANQDTGTNTTKTKSTSSSKTSYSFSFQGPSGSSGDTYDIVVELFDNNGNLVDKVVKTKTA